MSYSVNIASQLEKSLPDELLALVRAAADLAKAYGQRLYLVGGSIRDLLLGRRNLDIDLVVEGDALELAHLLTKIYGGDLIIHPRFGTAKFRKAGFAIDLATARLETYKRPGALPKVVPGSIRDDLFRRDFTINAMAVRLDPENLGELLDPYGGSDDLEKGLIRILYPNSFIDDATRILRAIRYEQRLGFHLEPSTEKLLRRDVTMMDTLSGDRLRHEIELILMEVRPEKAFLRSEELGVLRMLNPSLRGDGWLAERFEQARQLTKPDATLYLSLLIYQLSEEENEGLIQRLKVSGKMAKTMRDTIRLKEEIPTLADTSLSPSSIYRLLEGYSPQAILATSLASPSPIASSNLIIYVNKLRYMRPILNGEALKKMGVVEGPRIGEMLRALLDARLDGRVETKGDEEALVRGWLKGQASSSPP